MVQNTPWSGKQWFTVMAGCSNASRTKPQSGCCCKKDWNDGEVRTGPRATALIGRQDRVRKVHRRKLAWVGKNGVSMQLCSTSWSKCRDWEGISWHICMVNDGRPVIQLQAWTTDFVFFQEISLEKTAFQLGNSGHFGYTSKLPRPKR